MIQIVVSKARKLTLVFWTDDTNDLTHNQTLICAAHEQPLHMAEWTLELNVHPSTKLTPPTLTRTTTTAIFTMVDIAPNKMYVCFARIINTVWEKLCLRLYLYHPIFFKYVYIKKKHATKDIRSAFGQTVIDEYEETPVFESLPPHFCWHFDFNFPFRNDTFKRMAFDFKNINRSRLTFYFNFSFRNNIFKYMTFNSKQTSRNSVFKHHFYIIKTMLTQRYS